MLIRRERPGDETAIRRVHVAAFRRSDSPAEEPIEAWLLDELRASDAWIPPLSLVALRDGDIVGHVVCTRAELGPARRPVLGLGPIGVDPEHQRTGVGSALVHAVVAAADARSEPLVGLLGEPSYYARFGFEAAHRRAVDPPDARWGDYFQVRSLTAYTPDLAGLFTYAEPFARLPEG